MSVDRIQQHIPKNLHDDVLCVMCVSDKYTLQRDYLNQATWSKLTLSKRSVRTKEGDLFCNRTNNVKNASDSSATNWKLNKVVQMVYRLLIFHFLLVIFSKADCSIQGVLSESNPVFTGVPQGSILGTLLFIIHFNDVHKPLQSSRIIAYTDDTVIFTSSSNFDDIERNLNDINNLATWSARMN